MEETTNAAEETLEETLDGTKDVKAEVLEKVKGFLLENKDALMLAGQIAIVAMICVAGIRNDMEPQNCCCRRCRKKRKKARK